MTTLTPIDTQVDLTINKLTEEMFNDLSAKDMLDENQLYVVTEDQYMVLGQGSGEDYQIEISELSADKRDYTDLTYNQDHLALESQLSAYVTSAWVMNYVNDQISAALNAQL